jgi:hypothetical protein
MTEKRFELRLCNNRTYYLWNNNELTDIAFDKFNKESANELVDLLNELHEENQALKQELFESEVDYYNENYHDNPIRADNHILELKKEFKERFGRDFEYEGK